MTKKVVAIDSFSKMIVSSAKVPFEEETIV